MEKITAWNCPSHGPVCCDASPDFASDDCEAIDPELPLSTEASTRNFPRLLNVSHAVAYHEPSTALKIPKDLFTSPPEKGAPILQEYIDGLPADERYGVLAPLVRKHWKWFCRAAPYLKFPEPKPIGEGRTVNIGIRSHMLTSGGTERGTAQLANHFAKKLNCHATVFLDRSAMDRIDYPLDPNVEIVPVQDPINWALAVREHPQDLFVHLSYWKAANFQNILLLKLLGVRALAQERGGPNFRIPFRTMAEKFDHLVPLYSACDGMSCLSRDELLQWEKKGVTNSVYLPNSPTFPVEDVTPAPLDSKTILWVGRWDKNQKRPELALRAFAKILKDVPDARLIMLGTNTGQYQKCYLQCKKLIDRLGIGHAIDIGGFQKDLVPYYSSGALLLCTSAFEGFHRGIIEAKTFGLPVVSTAMPYLEPLKGGGCIQVPQGDADGLAAAAIDLLQNDEKRKKLGAEARQDVLKNFSSKATFEKYDAFFDAIFKGKEAVHEFCAKDLDR
ncbi:MAG: glycosyltransferase [Puniceicoccales bacterium]|jgi:glycosyltransferase involved in cell wall biosynthesis|nr:glycosyltransferase [Puniceicoccales bacterium]